MDDAHGRAFRRPRALDLDRFYSLARAILVKSETFYDQYDQAFAACFEGVETPLEIADEVWDWLSDPLALPGLTETERQALAAPLTDLDLEALQKLFEERLAEQDEAHHGGNRWAGTGGTSPFGHRVSTRAAFVSAARAAAAAR